MGFIYLIENDYNNQKYVGLTTRNIDIRWKEHLRHNEEPIDKAIHTHGAEHFHISQLEECEDKLLDEREQYWIAYYNSYANGYNATQDGRMDSNTVRFPDKLKLVKELWDEGCGQIEIVHITRLNVETVHNYLTKSQITDIMIRERQKEKLKKIKQKPILQFDKYMNLLKEWEGAPEAAKELGLNAKTINGACRGEQKTYKGFIWKYKENYNGKMDN